MKEASDALLRSAAPRDLPRPRRPPRASLAIALERPSLRARAGGALLAAWGAFTGALPHVLHHVGPLAGAALLAGATGRILFAAIGFVAAIPFLCRLHRRFRTWRAPALALAVFAAAFSLSSFVIGPAVSGADAPAQPGIEEREHDEHH